MTKTLGAKIKKLRIARSWTLKELGEKCRLSAGYLSLVERNLTTINLTSLHSIANAFGIEISAFFDTPTVPKACVMRMHEYVPLALEGSDDVYYCLAGEMPPDEGVMEPLIAVIKPAKEPYRHEVASHAGEEFGYVLEGIVTLILRDIEHELYPGDSFHIICSVPHAVINRSNRLARVLYVNTAKFLKTQ